jgi:hypothetical protein
VYQEIRRVLLKQAQIGLLFQLVGIFIDTSARIGDFKPDLEQNPSVSGNADFCSPFYRLGTLDVFATPAHVMSSVSRTNPNGPDPKSDGGLKETTRYSRDINGLPECDSQDDPGPQNNSAYSDGYPRAPEEPAVLLSAESLLGFGRPMWYAEFKRRCNNDWTTEKWMMRSVE